MLHCRDAGPDQAYRPRQPQETVLYQVLAEQVETSLDDLQRVGRELPPFVVDELHSFLICGIPQHGCCRVRCQDCGHSKVVAFSCKGRGFCPSCTGRRMADTAAHLVDRVWPERHIRQWVLSLPVELRFRAAYVRGLAGMLEHIWVRTLRSFLRLRARRAGIVEKVGQAETGAVTFVQRFGGALSLNVHFHTVGLDGVYIEGENGPEWCQLRAPSNEEVAELLEKVVRKITRFLPRLGILDEDEVFTAPLGEADPDEQLLLGLRQASVHGLIASGERAGQQVERRGGLPFPALGEESVGPQIRGRRCASYCGFSLHADVAVGGRSRTRLEHLFRYVAELMRRVWDADVLECERCQGRLRVIAALTTPEAIRAVLGALGMSTEPPVIGPPRGPPEPQLDWSW